jgi:hypothetical protein
MIKTVSGKDMAEKLLKTKKRRIILISIFVGFLWILSSYGLARLFVRWYDPSTYFEYDPDKMVVYLEEKYNINFPKNVREIKAAKSGMSWDRHESFILKFIAEPSDVNKFLETVVETILYPYYSSRDNRLAPFESAPEWWTKPIEKGKRGRMYVEVARIKDERSHIDIYIDTLDEKNNVVYLEGTYRSALDH